jgi:hypothetical protein
MSTGGAFGGPVTQTLIRDQSLRVRWLRSRPALGKNSFSKANASIPVTLLGVRQQLLIPRLSKARFNNRPKTWSRKQMKKPLVVAFVVSAIGLSVPTLAQQQKAVDAEVRKQIEAVFTEFQDAYNKHDAAAIAALYSPDAVELRSWRGLLSGQEAIRRIFAFDFASGGGKMASELLQLCPVGNAI